LWGRCRPYTRTVSRPAARFKARPRGVSRRGQRAVKGLQRREASGAEPEGNQCPS
jgi:hypothetical protein